MKSLEKLSLTSGQLLSDEQMAEVEGGVTYPIRCQKAGEECAIVDQANNTVTIGICVSASLDGNPAQLWCMALS